MAGQLEIGGGNHSPGCYPWPPNSIRKSQTFLARLACASLAHRPGVAGPDPLLSCDNLRSEPAPASQNRLSFFPSYCGFRPALVRKRPHTHMVSVFAQRVLPLLVLAVAVVSVPFLMLSPSGLPRLRNLEEERRRANEEISRLGSQITALRAEVSRIKSDPAAVERAARDELGLVRTTEVVFQFSD